MLKINLSKLNSKIDKYIIEYYSLEEKPVTTSIEDENAWIVSMVTPYVEYSILNLELKGFERIEVAERFDVKNNGDTVKNACMKKRGYDVVNRLGEYSNKYLVKGNKTAKVQQISLWEYKQKGELKSGMINGFKIGNKAFELGIGPKVYDLFVCFNTKENKAYKVVITDYIAGESLEEWLEKDRTDEEKKHMQQLVKTKIDTLHENGVIHNRLHNRNVIVTMQKGKISDVFITDYLNAKDTLDKTMWEFNDWMNRDRNVLRSIVSSRYSFDISDDVTTYVVHKLLEKKDIVIT
jgi:hypothetical protein